MQASQRCQLQALRAQELGAEACSYRGLSSSLELLWLRFVITRLIMRTEWLITVQAPLPPQPPVIKYTGKSLCVAQTQHKSKGLEAGIWGQNLACCLAGTGIWKPHPPPHPWKIKGQQAVDRSSVLFEVKSCQNVHVRLSLSLFFFPLDRQSWVAAELFTASPAPREHPKPKVQRVYWACTCLGEPRDTLREQGGCWNFWWFRAFPSASHFH